MHSLKETLAVGGSLLPGNREEQTRPNITHWDFTTNSTERTDAQAFQKAKATPGYTSKLIAKWHQLIGMLKITMNTFESKGLLLMDEVGLSKTVQIIGAMLILIYFRHYFGHTGDFPGAFSECLIRSKGANMLTTKI